MNDKLLQEILEVLKEIRDRLPKPDLNINWTYTSTVSTLPNAVRNEISEALKE